MGRSHDLHSLSVTDTERVLALWRELDGTHALHPRDRDFVASNDAPKSLIVDHLTREEEGRDLYNACAQLGRLMATEGTSPSFAASTLDSAAHALTSLEIPWNVQALATARASVAEGFAAGIVEAERILARRRWEYPACTVRLSEKAVAIVANYPTDDEDAVGDWAARVATGAARDGYRSAILSGSARAKDELAEALSLVGIACVERLEKDRWFTSLLMRVRRRGSGAEGA